MRLIILSFCCAIGVILSPFIYNRFIKKPHAIERAVYYWQTNGFYLNAKAESFLTQHHIKKIYTKVMDITWNEVYKAYPSTITDFSYNIKKDTAIKFIPVIFITNEVMQHTMGNDLKTLAHKLVLKTQQLCGNANDVEELQLDCDWTESTKNNYFKLLTLLKENERVKKISVTIRLHQIKYQDKTGIPPADRGTLMLYNTGNVTNYNETNSIFSASETVKYISRASNYQLPLDIALPSYSWGILFKRKQFNTILNDIRITDLIDTTHFTKKDQSNYYTVKSDFLLNYRTYLRAGDEIRFEHIDTKALQDAVLLANKCINTNSFTVSFYEINSDNIQHIDSVHYEKAFHSFR
jgi:hypothetical protein